MLLHILAGVFGYLIGSFPTAYLFVKWKSNIDIRQAGSGSVGTLNSYEVTNSKSIGAAVLIFDLLKGVLAITLTRLLFGTEFFISAVGGIGAVVGHNFPVWLKFKGGRGLATAAGVMLMLAWVFVPIWMLAWLLGNKVSKDVNVGNTVGTFVVLLVVFSIPDLLLVDAIPDGTHVDLFRVFVALLTGVILVRLVEPVREYFLKKKS